MAKDYTPNNRYYRGSKLTEAQFELIVLAFSLGMPARELILNVDISLRSINALLVKLRRRVFEDIRLDPMQNLHGPTGRPPADHQFWQDYRACLYDCPSLRMKTYPQPRAKAIAKPWHPLDYDEWRGLCGVLHHRRHPFWKPLEAWSEIHFGLPAGLASALVVEIG